MQIRKLLMLLNDGDAAPAAAPQQAQSFAERKAAQLREERTVREAAEQPTEPEPRSPVQEDDGYPQGQSESVQDDGYPELHDGGDELEAGDPDGALEDETPPEGDYEDDGEPTVDWEKRFKDTQAELTRAREQQQEQNGELTEMMAGSLQLKYDLEDHLTKARQYTEFYVNGIDNQIMQMERAFNSGAIDPERMQEARQQYQSLQQQKQQLNQRIEQVETTRSEAEAVRKKREAEITRVRLQRTIPDWSQQKYNEMRQEAVKRGYTVEEFSEITDHRYFEMLHDSMLLRSAKDTVGDVTKRKRPKPPRGRRNATQSRDGRGRFEKTKREFRENPNQKGRFAAMKAEQLQRERRGN